MVARGAATPRKLANKFLWGGHPSLPCRIIPHKLRLCLRNHNEHLRIFWNILRAHFPHRLCPFPSNSTMSHSKSLRLTARITLEEKHQNRKAALEEWWATQSATKGREHHRVGGLQQKRIGRCLGTLEIHSKRFVIFVEFFRLVFLGWGGWPTEGGCHFGMFRNKLPKGRGAQKLELHFNF